MPDDDGDALKQQDLSRLHIQAMTTAERAELKRRYAAFVRHFAAPEVERPVERPVRKWVPGERAATSK